VILCGILAVVTWKKQTMVLANLFVLLSIICVLLSVASFALTCQGIKFVSSVPRCDVVDMGQDKVCFCCEAFPLAKCTEETALKLYHTKSCNEARLSLKKVLFVLCTLNGLSIIVCLSAGALHSLEVWATRRSCRVSESKGESLSEGTEDSDDSDFAPSVSPAFLSTYSHIPRMRRRMPSPDVIPLPHIYGVRIKGTEVFCSLDPPSYEDAVRQNNSYREGAPPVSAVQARGSGGAGDSQASQGAELNCETATQTEVERQVGTVALQSSLGSPLMGRPLSLVGKISYRDVERLAGWIIEQSPHRMSPDLRELVESIKPVLKPDERPEEASTSAASLEQAMAPAQQAVSLKAHVLALKKRFGLLQLEGGDVTTDEEELAEGRIQTADD
ncbi:PREDICTED: protein FAM189A2, partial [Buceros rhinoceros silvestris]|uniref:protein FAM189A2 n=1 Tax=Buceros rhinoceros silvestris TaxID=175836 RepID=UPI0005287858